MADFFATSLARIPDLVEKIAYAPKERFPFTRPHGLIVLRLAAVRPGELVPLTGPPIPVVGRIAVPGEEPEEDTAGDRNNSPHARAPYLAIGLLARPGLREPVRTLSAYVHPCASNDRLMLVDSNLERQTLEQLLTVQSWLLRKKGMSVTIAKPLEDMSTAIASGQPESRPVVMPDFVVTGQIAGAETRTVAVETKGFSDEGYRERKARMYPLMSAAIGDGPVVSHDFHRPPATSQRSRDEWFWHELRRALLPV